MPNWCTNKLIVTGEDTLVDEFKNTAEGPDAQVYGLDMASDENIENSALSFHSLVPIPDETLKGSYSGDGYDAEIRLWGCKWGACYAELEEDSGRLQYSFDTAWSPPIPLLLAASDRFPELTFDLQYEDSNVDMFGRIEVRNGNVVRQIDWDAECEPSAKDKVLRQFMKQCVQLTIVDGEALPNSVNGKDIGEYSVKLAKQMETVSNQTELLINNGWNCFLRNEGDLKVICTHCDVGSESDKEKMLSEIGLDPTLAG